MNRDLSPLERNLLQALMAKLRLQNQVVRKLKKTDLKLLAWCYQQDLITDPNTLSTEQEYRYTSELIQAIAERLAQLGLAALNTDLKLTSTEQLAQGKAEHKTVRISPREQRVLRAFGEQILDQDQRELALAQFTELVVIENLDCFYDWQCFTLPLQPNSLVIYRGDAHYSSGRKNLLKRWLAGAYGPLKYFGDLDPEGFDIAITEGFSHLAAPEFNWFSHHATEHAYPGKQHSTAQKLPQRPELQPYIAFMQRYQRALLQQSLQQVPLQWLIANS